jgi:hypothetical protein
MNDIRARDSYTKPNCMMDFGEESLVRLCSVGYLLDLLSVMLGVLAITVSLRAMVPRRDAQQRL